MTHTNSKHISINLIFFCRSWRGVTPEFVHSLMAKEFPSLNSKPIHYYYGLNHYIVLAPGKNEREDIDNESRSKMALSSIAVALNNTRCSIPCFVQVMVKSFKNQCSEITTYNFYIFLRIANLKCTTELDLAVASGLIMK